MTANVYAHLDINDKLESAKAMKWLDDTSLAKGSDDKTEHTAPECTPKSNDETEKTTD